MLLGKYYFLVHTFTDTSRKIKKSLGISWSSYKSAKERTLKSILEHSQNSNQNQNITAATKQLILDFYNRHDQGIIQKKSASGSRTLPFVIFDKKVPFFPKNGVILTYFWEAHCQKCSFFKDSRCCPQILDYTLMT